MILLLGSIVTASRTQKAVIIIVIVIVRFIVIKIEPQNIVITLIDPLFWSHLNTGSIQCPSEACKCMFIKQIMTCLGANSQEAV